MGIFHQQKEQQQLRQIEASQQKLKDNANKFNGRNYQDEKRKESFGQRFLNIFRKNIRAIQTESKYGKGSTATTYTYAKSVETRRHPEDEAALNALKQEKHNSLATVGDYRFAKAFTKLKGDNKTRFEAAFDEKIRGRRYDRGQNTFKGLFAFMETSEVVSNDRMGQYMDLDRREELVMSFTDEVVAYNFSEAMLNKHWLAENASTFAGMIEKAIGLQLIYESNENLYKKLPDDLKKLIACKADQARALKEMAFSDLRTRGMEIDEEENKYELNGVSIEEKAELQKNGERERKQFHSRFVAAKKNELRLTAKRSSMTEAEETGISKLSFEDFAAMIGTKNRGQVEFSKGKLKIINNHFFSSSKGNDTELNYTVKERFLAATLERLTDSEARSMRPYLMSILGLNNKEKVSSLPLTRKMIRKVVSEVSAMHSGLERDLHRDQQHDNEPMVKIAKKVDSLLPKKAETSQERSAAKTMIKNLLREGRYQREKVPSVSTHQMDNILNGNLETLRDNVFQSLKALDRNILNVAAGADVDPDTWLNDEVFIKQIIAFEIKKMIARTDNKVTDAENQMDTLMSEKAFAAAGKQDQMATFSAVFVGSYSNEGDRGLWEYLELRKDRIGVEVFDSENFQKKISDFGQIMNNFKLITDGIRSWYNRENEGDAYDAEALVDAAAQIDKELGEQGKYDDLLAHLRGTRFETGFREALEKFANGEFRQKVMDLTDIMRSRKKMRNVIPEVEAPIGEMRRLELNAQENAILASFTKEEKALADVLLLNKKPSEIIDDQNVDAAKEIMALRNALSEFGPDDSFIMNVNFGGATMLLEKRKDGAVFLGEKGRRIMLPISASRLKDHLEIDMVSNMTKYGDDEVMNLVFDKRFVDEYKDQHYRNLAVRALESLTGAPAVTFRHQPTYNLRNYINSIVPLHGEARKKKIKEVVKDAPGFLTYNLYNDKLTSNLLDAQKRAYRDLPEKPVELAPEEKRRPAQGEEAWSKEEEAVKNFMADMVFGLDTIDADDEYEKNWRKERGKEYRGERLLNAMTRNMEALYIIMDDDTILDRTLDKMALPEVKGKGKKPLKTSIAEDMKLIMADEGFKKLKEDRKKGVATSQLATDFAIMMGKKLYNGELEVVEKRIDEDVDQVIESMQDEISDAAEVMFRPQEKKKSDFVPQDPFEKDITYEEQQKRIKARAKELDRLIEEESKGSSGQGMYTKTVLQTYFKNSSEKDQRAMVASILRNSVPKKDMKGASKQAIEEENTRLKGITMGGFLKGAGPLLQKMLQGMPDQGIPEAMKIALADMKSNLAPIPDEMVRLRLDSIVKSSEDITKIQIVRTLGAASVGQAFLCKMYGPNIPEEGREVVVKVLRPEAKQRMDREKSILLNAAKKCDPGGGMEETYKGQFAKIEEEFDLSIEAQNAKKGLVYNNGGNVKTVGVDNLVYATANTLVLEKASGTTVDKYMNDSEKTRKEALSGLYQYDDKNEIVVDEKTKRPVLKMPENKKFSVTYSRKKLEGVLRQMEKRQKYLTEVADKWVREGIYGKGFYHGDLHAGNIMIDDNGATIIDFGNAVTLTGDQQLQLTRLTAAAAVQDMNDFRDAFKNLLQEKSLAKYNEVEDKLGEEINKIFAIGTKESAGQMISLILMKAQSLGLEVPAAINSFSQSQIRLQNTIDSMNDMIFSLRADLKELDGINCNANIDVVEIAQQEAIEKGQSLEETMKSYGSILLPDSLAIYKEIRLTGASQRSNFDRDRVAILKKDSPRVALLKQKLKALRDAQDQKQGDISALEDDVVAAYEAACEETRRESAIADKVKDALAKEDEASVKAVEQELEAWFADKENGGDLLRDAYDAYRISQKDKAPEDEMTKAQNLFLDRYLTMAGKRIDALVRDLGESTVNIKSFFDVMTDVLNNNLKASLDRLGYRKAISYTRELDKRTLLDAPVEKKTTAKKTDRPVADQIKLDAVRNRVREFMPQELPTSLKEVEERRTWKDRIAERVTNIDEKLKQQVRKNQVNEKNEDNDADNYLGADKQKTESPREVWNKLCDEFANPEKEEWLSPEEKRNEPQQYKKWPDYFKKLTEAMETDFKMLEGEKDRYEQLRLEMEYHKAFVEMPKQYGGVDFFKDILSKAFRVGGKYAGRMDEFANIDKAHKLRVFRIVNMLGGYAVDYDKQVVEYLARMLMLFGERMEEGFKVRRKEFLVLDDKKKRAFTKLRLARENREKGGQEFVEWCKEDKENAKLAEEYDGSGDKKKALMKKLEDLGWKDPEEIAILDDFRYHTFSGFSFNKDNMKGFLAFLTQQDATKPERRIEILTLLSKFINKIARGDEEFGYGNGSGIDIFSADLLQTRIEKVCAKLAGKPAEEEEKNPNRYRKIRARWREYRKNIKSDYERKRMESNLEKYTKRADGNLRDGKMYFTAFLDSYAGQTDSPMDTMEKLNMSTSKDAFKEELRSFEFDRELTNLLVDCFYSDKNGEDQGMMSEMMMHLLVSMRRHMKDNPGITASKETLEHVRSGYVAQAMSLLQLDSGARNDDYQITCTGVVSKENREKLLEMLGKYR